MYTLQYGNFGNYTIHYITGNVRVHINKFSRGLSVHTRIKMSLYGIINMCDSEGYGSHSMYHSSLCICYCYIFMNIMCYCVDLIESTLVQKFWWHLLTTFAFLCFLMSSQWTKNGNGFFSRKPVCRSSHIMSSTGHSKLSTISYGSCLNGQTVHHEHPSFYLHYPLQTSLVHLLWATHWWDLVKLTYLCTILSVAVWHYSSK